MRKRSERITSSISLRQEEHLDGPIHVESDEKDQNRGNILENDPTDDNGCADALEHYFAEVVAIDGESPYALQERLQP